MDNRSKARDYFKLNDERIAVWEANGIDWVLHHIDPSWQYEDPERYEQWNIEDLLPMTRKAHTAIHHTNKITSDETKRLISEKHKGHFFMDDTQKELALEKAKATMTAKYGGMTALLNTPEAKAKAYASRNTPDNLVVIGKHISQAKKEADAKRSPEERQRIHGHSKGKVWINNGTEQHTVSKDVLDSYLENGYVLGKLKK